MNNERPQDDYRPRSPNLPSFQPPPQPDLGRIPSFSRNDSVSGFPQGYSFSPRGSYDASPYFSPQTSQAPSYFGNQSQQPIAQSPQFTAAALPPQPYFFHPFDDMARLRSRKQVNYDENREDAAFNEATSIRYPVPQPVTHAPQPPHPVIRQPVPSSIDVKTKFPVARIKRIMQADEDVGKVAQATPTAVAKALELFMIALVSKGASDANLANSKRVTASHLKHALLSDPQFDFLKDICENVPDEAVRKSKTKEAASDESGSDADIGPAKKKARNRRKKASDESD